MLLEQIELEGRRVPKEEGGGAPQPCATPLPPCGCWEHPTSLVPLNLSLRGGGGLPSPPFLLTIADKVLVPDTILTWVTTT